MVRDDGPPPGPVLDWDELLSLAERHQVAALLHWKAGSSARRAAMLAGAPALHRGALRRAWLHHLLRNQHLATNLADVDRALRQRGIESLVLKGPWLAFEAYPDPGTRTVDDIDLCVRERDYRATRSALGALGYEPCGASPTEGHEALSSAHYDGQLRFRGHGRRLLELHFRMVNMGPPGPEEDWLWSSSRELVLPGATIRVPGAEAMLLHLALHAAQHGFKALRLLLDLRFALERDGASLDHAAFLRLVRARRCAASVYHALLLSREMAGAPVASALLDALRPSRLRRGLFSHLWGLPAVRALDPPERSTRFEAPRLYLLEMDGLRRKMSYLARIARLRKSAPE